MIGYVKCFDDNKTISFLADDMSSGLDESRKGFLKEYIKVWEKIRDLIGKNFDSEPVSGDKYIKKKIKSYNNDIINYYNDLITDDFDSSSESDRESGDESDGESGNE